MAHEFSGETLNKELIYKELIYLFDEKFMNCLCLHVIYMHELNILNRVPVLKCKSP